MVGSDGARVHVSRAFAVIAGLLALALLIATTVVPVQQASAQEQQISFVRLANSVVPAVSNGQLKSVSTPSSAANQSLTLTVTLNRSDQSGFTDYLSSMDNPASPNYRHHLTPGELAQRFGPSQSSYDAVLSWLRSKGFNLVQGSSDRLTITVKGTETQAVEAFNTQIGYYQADGHTTYSNTEPLAVPENLASYVQSVSGLSDLATPTAPRASTESSMTPTQESSLKSLLSTLTPAQQSSLKSAFSSLTPTQESSLKSALSSVTPTQESSLQSVLSVMTPAQQSAVESARSSIQSTLSGASRSSNDIAGLCLGALGIDIAIIALFLAIELVAWFVTLLFAAYFIAALACVIPAIQYAAAPTPATGGQSNGSRGSPGKPGKPEDPPLSITTSDLVPDLQTNPATPYSDYVEASGGVQPYMWSVSGLPNGWGMNTSTGQVFYGGTPSTPTGGYSPTFTVTDANNNVVTKTINLTVSALTMSDVKPSSGLKTKSTQTLRTPAILTSLTSSSSPASSNAQDPDTNPQKIGLLEYDTYNTSDVTDWQNYMRVFGGPVARLSEVNVDGGASLIPGQPESEVLLDIVTAIMYSDWPGSSYVVYDAPTSASFESIFNAMISDGDTVISNSWAQCEDETSQSEADAIDSVLAEAAASGISVFNASGDNGGTCIDGSPNTVGVPADSPHATAVGGTSLTQSLTTGAFSESWWGATQTTSTPDGSGGFGVSKYFTRPSYQDGFTTSTMRSVPDVVSDGDPATGGVEICQADGGGCPSGLDWGGTSMTTPAWAASVATLNEELGYNIGQVNPALYSLAGTDANAFHSASSMTSPDNDFAHVGLGSPNYSYIFQGLSGEVTGAVDPDISEVTPASGLEQVPADGTSTGDVAVRLKDGNGNIVSGKTVALTSNSGCSAQISAPSGPSDTNNGFVGWAVTDTVPETCTFTAVDTSDGVTLATQPTVTFLAPAASGAEIYGGPAQVNNDGMSEATITVYLENSLDQPASGKTVSISDGAGSAVITPAGTTTPGTTAVTNSAGNAVFTATDTTAESVDFTATDTTDGNLPVPGSVSVNFAPTTATCPTALPTPASGTSVSAFATGISYNTEGAIFPGNFTEGACNTSAAPAFDSSGNAYIADTNNGTIHVLPPSGGALSAANQLPDASFPPDTIGQLVFGPDGSLYAGLGNFSTDVSNPEIVQLDPTTGATIRVVADSSNGLPDCPYVMAVDPLSGDLFTDDECSGYAASDQISRISDPSGANPTVSDYYTTGGCNLGLTFAPRWHPLSGQLQRRGRRDHWNEHRYPDREHGRARIGHAVFGCGDGDQLVRRCHLTRRIHLQRRCVLG